MISSVTAPKLILRAKKKKKKVEECKENSCDRTIKISSLVTKRISEAEKELKSKATKYGVGRGRQI